MLVARNNYVDSKYILDTSTILPEYIEFTDLEKLILQKLKQIGITSKSYPLDSRKVAYSFKNISISYLNFSTYKFGAICCKDENNKLHTIALNKRRSKKGKNFDCMHELIHLWFHPCENYMCIDNNFVRQNNFRECQANNGAAIALMPTKLFRKKFKEFLGDIEKLSNYFNVGNEVIRYRIQNSALLKNYKQHICPVCNNYEISDYPFYCSICGTQFMNKYKNTRGDFMKYAMQYTLDENSKATVCPVCDNEHIVDGEFCQICGTYLVNKCDDTRPNRVDYCGCGHPAEANARYCSICGNPTTFYNQKLLCDWREEKNQGFYPEQEVENDPLPF